MDALDDADTSNDFGIASVPMRLNPGIGESNTFAADIPQSSRPSSPDAGIRAPNHGSVSSAYARPAIAARATLRIIPADFAFIV